MLYFEYRSQSLYNYLWKHLFDQNQILKNCNSRTGLQIVILFHFLNAPKESLEQSMSQASLYQYLIAIHR